MRYITITPVKRYNRVSKQFDRLPKVYLQQRDLTLGQLLDTHFPISPPSKDTGSGRTSSNIPSITLHMLWTDIEDHDLYPDYGMMLPPEDLSIQPANESSTITPATPLTISDGPASIGSGPILEEDQDTVAEMFEAMSDPVPDLDSELDPDSEPELPAHVINRKVS